MSGIDCAVQSVLRANQGALHNQVSITVAAKQLNVTRQQGDAMNAILEQAVELSKTVGSGQGFDAQA